MPTTPVKYTQESNVLNEYLNEHQINTPTGLEYYLRLMGVLRKKMRKAEERSLNIKSNLSEIGNLTY